MADATHVDLLDLMDINATAEWQDVQGAVRIVSSSYVNRVWSTDSDGAATPGFVRWTTNGAADPTGAAYPSSRGTFGVDTSDYCVETIR